MLSHNEQKLIRSLVHNKYRQRHQLFVAEGHKVIETISTRYKPVKVFATEETADRIVAPSVSPTIVTPRELQQVSNLQHPQGMLALFPLPATIYTPFPPQLTLALDAIQDPGNLGTIIRIADWFGIQHIVCSQDTADAYAPKAIQATMGSIAHVDIQYTDLPQWLDSLPDDFPAFATTLDGDNLYEAQLPANAVIVMGNEGNGVSQEVQQRLSKKLYIPSYNNQEKGAESLNVAMATAIICAEWRRRG